MASRHRLFAFLLIASAVHYSHQSPILRVKRQAQSPQQGPIANGQILTTAIQIPIQTLNAVHDLLQATRGRIMALGQRYQEAQQRHPNHHLRPGDKADRRLYNSKALYQR